MNKPFYSVYSGVIYQTDSKFYSLLDEGQLPLTKKPKKCNYCHGRGYIGFSTSSYTYPPCNCIKRVIDNDSIKSKFNIKYPHANV